MIAKKVIRYYSDCGRGFWKKKQALKHDEYCKCWVNPKFQCCLSCKNKNFVKDSNGMESEPQFLQKWDTNLCKHSELGVPVHENFEHIRKYCPYYETKKPVNNEQRNNTATIRPDCKSHAGCWV